MPKTSIHFKLVFFAVFCFFTSGASIAADLEIDDQTGAVGSSVTFTVSIDSAPNGVSAIGFDIVYDSAILSYDRFENGELADTGFSFFDVNTVSAGTLIFGAISGGGDAIAQGESGTLIELMFHVVGDGSCDVAISDPKDSVATWTTENGRFATETASVNTRPVSHDRDVTVDENTPAAITLDASDADGDALTYQLVLDPSHGTLTGTAPDLTYMPDLDFAGSDMFTFRANDGQEDSRVATVNITVEPAEAPANTPPQALDISAETDTNTPVSVTLAASDADGDPLSYEVVDGPAHGTLAGAAPDLVYTPAPGYAGVDVFTFKAGDGEDESGAATVTITVDPGETIPENTPPVASGQNAATIEDSPVSITLAASDADVDMLTFEIVDPPANGTLAGAPPEVTYTPASGHAGSDSFTFLASDGQSDSNTATVFITVEARSVEPSPTPEPTPESTPEPGPTPDNTSGDSGDGGGGGGCFVSVSAGS